MRLKGEAVNEKGQKVPLLPLEALCQTGPILRIILTPLKEVGNPPLPVAGGVLIDTGAAETCVDITAAQQAGLAQVGRGTMNSATHTNQEVPIFAGRLTIEGAGIEISMNRAIGANLFSHGIIALIGRDLLARCILTYNGPDGSFSLSI